MSFLTSLHNYGKLVKFSHSIFALPFALSMLVILLPSYQITSVQIVWLIVAMVSARTAAMGFNRIADKEIDSKNPRTRARELPSGVISARAAGRLTLLAAALFILSAAALGRHCLVLSPLVLAVLLLYSYTKRFTWLSHYVLGLALALAPGGVWYAITGRFAWEPVPLMIAVLFWVGGFDIIYSCQDVEFDKLNGLYSLPSRLGIASALSVSRILHLLCIVGLVYFGRLNHLGAIYYAGVAIFGALLLSQQKLVRPGDLSKVDLAFFTKNGQASLVFLLGVAADVFSR